MALKKKKQGDESVPASETTAAPKRKKKGKKWIIIVILVLILAAAAVFFFLKRKAPTAVQTSEYVTAQVETRNITKTLSGSGTLQPADSYTVTSLVSGEILSADFEEGDIVQEDDVLYELDSSDVSNNIEKAQLSVDQASRNYSSTADKQYIKSNASGVVYSLDVKVGDNINAGQQIATIRDSAVMTLKVPFPSDDAQKFYLGETAVVTLDSTFETLTGAISEISTVDNVGTGNSITRNVTIQVKNPGGLTNGQSATATVAGIGCAASATFEYNAESVVTATSSGTVASLSVSEGSKVSRDDIILTLGGSDIDDQLQSASDNLKNAQLSMESTQDQLDNYTITSPISGTVVTKSYKAGDKAESNKALCVIYDLSYLEFTLNVDELDISDVSVGQEVTITADAVEGVTYNGVVTKVSVAGTTSGGTTSYPVTIRVDETDGLLPGMNVDAEIVVESSGDTLTIPNAAVTRGNAVLVTSDSPSAANANDTEAPEGYVYVDIETGISDDDYVQVVSGLQEGDTVAYVSGFSSSSLMDTMMGMGQEGMDMNMGGGDMGGGMGSMPQGGPSGGGGFPG